MIVDSNLKSEYSNDTAITLLNFLKIVVKLYGFFSCKIFVCFRGYYNTSFT